MHAKARAYLHEASPSSPVKWKECFMSDGKHRIQSLLELRETKQLNLEQLNIVQQELLKKFLQSF